MRHTITTQNGDKLGLISKVLTVIAIIEIVIATIALIRGEIMLTESEELYSEISKIIVQRRPSVKEQTYLYIKALEVPEEIIVESVEILNFTEPQNETICYYNPTEEERQMAYLVAMSEAGIEDSFGQTLVINVAINDMKARGYSNLIEEFTAQGRYSSVKNGVPSIKQNGEWIPVTEDMLSNELKVAVDTAFEKDYTEELLKEVAETKNLGDEYYKNGALYFYNPNALSDYQESIRSNIQVSFKYGRHVFYRVWDQ